MTQTRRRKRHTVAVQAAELSAAVPQVVFHRMARLAMAGIHPKPGDRAEFRRMGAEKVAAWQESWLAMWQQAWVLQQQVLSAMVQAAWSPWSGERPSPARVHRQLSESTADIVSKGLAPVHRRAVANARRLSRRGPL